MAQAEAEVFDYIVVGAGKSFKKFGVPASFR